MTITNAARSSSRHEEGTAALEEKLIEARRRTLALVADLTPEQLLGPKLAIVNPPLWEIGHLAWFQERWCLRHRGDQPLARSLLADADALYDSASVAHGTRWALPLPSLEKTLSYLEQVLDRVGERLARAPSRPLRYFAELAAAHEEMHCEAFTYTRQTLGYAEPSAPRAPVPHTAGAIGGDAEIPGGDFVLGAQRRAGFVFDNEKWAHPVRLEPYRISRVPVTNAQFAEFIDDRGYERRELWCANGWNWRADASAANPAYWHKVDGVWLERRYDAVAPLAQSQPVCHVNWFEAEAYCRWAKRRLPSEAEWEYAAAASVGGQTKRLYPWGEESPTPSTANFYGAAGATVDVAAFGPGDSPWQCRQMMGNVWEWTAGTFEPYPGFLRDPYKEYSEPWFGTHKVLRGGSFATRGWLMRNTWRNFYTPDRRDLYAGFRTCA